MKKIILTAAALAGLTLAAEAQYARFGVKVGGMVTTASREDNKISNVKNQFAPGAYAGGLIEFSFKKKSDKFKLQLEANYNWLNVRHKYTVGNASFNDRSSAHFVTVPLLAKYFFKPNFSLFLGPTANFNIATNRVISDANNNKNSNNVSDEVNKFQLGAMIGANYYFYKGFFLEARYQALIPEFYEINTSAWPNNTPEFGAIHNLQIGVGWKFRNK